MGVVVYGKGEKGIQGFSRERRGKGRDDFGNIVVHGRKI